MTEKVVLTINRPGIFSVNSFLRFDFSFPLFVSERVHRIGYSGPYGLIAHGQHCNEES